MADRSRRDFLAAAATLGAGITIVPRHVLGGVGYRAPSDTITVACIGVGGMGRNDVRGVMQRERVVALCDVNQYAAQDAYRMLPDARRYTDFRRMLEAESGVDAITVSTPDHTHYVAAMAALQAGKHVYCQKPLTRTVTEARKLAAEARSRPRQVTQMGNQGHAAEGIRRIREIVEAGLIGTVQRVEYWTDRPIWPQAVTRPSEMHHVPATLDWEQWLGPAPFRPWHPRYAPFNWRGWWDFGTGAMGDMACHLMDAAYWILDLRYPARVAPDSSPLFDETAPATSRVEYTFPARNGRPAVTLVWRDGNLRPPRPFDWPENAAWPHEGSAQCWVGDKGTLVAGTYGENPRLSDPVKQAELDATPLPERYPRTEGVHAEWFAAIKAGTRAGSDFGEYAGRMTEMILLGNLAVRSGRTVECDPETGTLRTGGIPDDFITPVYRSGWTL